jgi:8-oxo-dGTP pyrophosphatase MutT (NUDIX family)
MAPFPLADLERYLRDRLTQPLPGADAQWRFSPRPTRRNWSPDQQPETARRAAALILLYPGDAGAMFPLTMRHSDLPIHAGQISLPGGRIDPGESPEQAAVREAQEEIGVDPADVRVIGSLSTLWVVVSNHLLWPIVAVTDRRPDFQIAPREVEALIEVPIAQLRDAGCIGWSRHVREGIVVDYPHLELSGHQVWGATGMVLGELACLFDRDFGKGKGHEAPATAPRQH